jgi:N-acetylglucosaminyl-diphospho-decaprenol L-rhamnosyltransferase
VLSILIVTRNTKDLLTDLLTSIRNDASLRPHLREVIVVDNGSSDGTDEMTRERFPEVLYLKNQENRGFAAAVNQGLARSSGDFLLLLNSDTRLIPGELQKFFFFMVQNPSVAVAGPQLVYEDMKPQRSVANVPSLLTEVVPSFILERLFPNSFGVKENDGKTPRDVPTLIGAALMIRIAAARLLRGFDERFFFFLEETDFCVRARAKDYRVVFYPLALVVHLQGRTVRRTWVRGRIEYAISLYRFIGKYHSDLYERLFVMVRVSKALLFLVGVSLLPFLLISASARRRYAYYARLLYWHAKGRPDDAGLRSNSPG